MSTEQETQGTSTRPYLIRALHDWCTDNGFTPYLAVYVDRSVQVPREYVKNNEIVLNVSFEATSQLQLGNEYIEFKARFGGVARDISVPVDHVIAIYARENGQGMAFPVPTSLGGEGVDAPSSPDNAAEGAEARTPVPHEGAERSHSPLRLAGAGSAKASGKDAEREAAPKAAGTGPTKLRPAAIKPVEPDAALESSAAHEGQEGDDGSEPPPGGNGGGRPALRRIK